MRSYHQSGQALITLIVFTAIASSIIVGSVAVVVETTRGSSAITQGQHALAIAESAGQNAILQLLRNPDYTGETMSIGSGSALITVTGSTTKTIQVTANANGYQRRVQLIGSFQNNTFTLQSWQEL